MLLLLYYSENSDHACRNTFLFLCGGYLVSVDQIFVNIQEVFALLYSLCLRNKDIFAENL